MELSLEQQIIYDKYLKGENIFMTGPGGSGKSELIKKIYNDAIQTSKNISVCALTGCAAILLNCKAKTIHSWAGIGIATGSLNELINKVKFNKYTKANWLYTDTLVVDEVSMMSLKLFDILDKIGKNIRNNNKPFGGIQLIFSGDFFQLPPVGNKNDIDTMRFCFESENWCNVFSLDNQIPLIKIFRQSDEIYSTILNEIRKGIIKKKTNTILLNYVGREIDINLLVKPTKLFSTRNKVDDINNSELDLLDGELKEFKTEIYTDLGVSNTKFNEKEIKFELDYLTKNLLCEDVLKLKIGAQVMCIINFQSVEICNGSQGIITKFCQTTGYPFVKFNNNLEILIIPHIWKSEKITNIGLSQIPLILAWGITIHKSQGSTLDIAELDIGSDIFECGQTYVALSRIKTLNGLYLTSYDFTKIKANKIVYDYYEKISQHNIII